MAPTDKCDLCKYVRYSRDGGSTYCGRRKEQCKFTPKKAEVKLAPSAAQELNVRPEPPGEEIL